MPAANVREHLIATGVRFVTDVLNGFLSGRWDMEERLSLAGAQRRRESCSPEERRNRHSHLSQSSMRSEEKRLRTFRHWPATVPAFPEDLAAAGFFFLGPDDRVKCFCCGGVLYDWLAEDDPIAEHKKFFPTCRFIQGKDVGNRPMLHAEETLDCVDGQFLSTLQGLSMEGASGESQPEYPGMELESDRLTTFGNWPTYARVSPESLARAGFFYTGERDYVRCFYCDGALSNWERGDDPWMEHARWFPRCKFLLQSRGRDFVNAVQDPDNASLASPENTVHWVEQQPESSGVSPQREQHPCRRRQLELEHAREQESALSVEEKLRRLQEERMCKVCMDKDVSIVLVPCGHLVVCTECVPNLRHCPICRGAIRDTIKAFLS
uniref:RING-type E3 ubiquitin transferase n=1 Tax=Salvator merianae TaxID=96440 RepID=A0A8D0CA55_SALMN